MAELTKEIVKHVASLAKIAVSDEEAETYAKQLSNTMSFVNILNELNTDNVIPMTHPLQLYECYAGRRTNRTYLIVKKC